MAKSRQKSQKSRPKGGRPRGKILDNPYKQYLLLRRIITSGRERNCWRGVVSRRTYEVWKNDPENATWKERVERAIKQHYNHQNLADPELRERIMMQLENRLNAGKLSNKELLQFLQYLPEHCEVLLHEK